MFHYFEAITNTNGGSLVGYFVRVIDPVTLATVPIYADDSGTPIATVSNIANMAKTDSAGNASFFVTPGTYHFDIYGSDAATFYRRVASIPFGVSGATGITFTLPGTGTGPRSGQAKFADTASILDFAGVDPTGATDSTTGLIAAFASGRRLFAPAGTYLCGNVDIPNGLGFTMEGEGPSRTIFQANAANTPVFRKAQTAGACEHGHMGGFSLKAHASGSTGGAFNCSGFRAFKFHEISGLSNGTAGFQSLFDISASPYLTYGCEWNTIILAAQTGWTNVFLFNNRGAGVAYNANANRIVRPWIYSNVGLGIAIDAARSAQTSITGGLIESNSGATAIRLGQGSEVSGVWMEANAADIAFGTLTDGTGNNSSVRRNTFSTAHTIDLTGVVGNLWYENIEAGAQTWTNNNGQNIKLTPPANAAQAPTLAYSSGQTGTLTLSSTAALSVTDFDSKVTYRIVYTWTAGTASTQTKFLLSPPTGWNLTQVSGGVVRGSTGEPARIALDTTTGCWLYNAYNDSHTITLLVTMAVS
jgi:hypothetical protein